tara:strand:+ start:7249 stop:7764 length:516 start_codon:yes stop_codon:yes gene_type:complete
MKGNIMKIEKLDEDHEISELLNNQKMVDNITNSLYVIERFMIGKDISLSDKVLSANQYQLISKSKIVPSIGTYFQICYENIKLLDERIIKNIKTRENEIDEAELISFKQYCMGYLLEYGVVKDLNESREVIYGFSNKHLKDFIAKKRKDNDYGVIRLAQLFSNSLVNSVKQ